MFEELHKLVSEGKCSLIMTVSAKGDNLVLRLAPLPGDKDAPAALSQKLELEGTPAEMNAEFQNILASYGTTRRTLQQALDDAATIMQAATKDASDKTVAAIAKGNGKPAAPPVTPPLPESDVAPASDKQTIELF